MVSTRTLRTHTCSSSYRLMYAQEVFPATTVVLRVENSEPAEGNVRQGDPNPTSPE